jgi:predicted nucleic acid-binding protein
VILVDSSAWIEFQRATGSSADLRLKAAIEVDEPLAVLGLIFLEVLAGARDESQAKSLNRMLSRCRLLTLEEPSDYESAAALYRACRREGTTVRRLPDCLIAAVAIREDVRLLHQDSDFDAIARHSQLQVVAFGEEDSTPTSASEKGADSSPPGGQAATGA